MLVLIARLTVTIQSAVVSFRDGNPKLRTNGICHPVQFHRHDATLFLTFFRSQHTPFASQKALGRLRHVRHCLIQQAENAGTALRRAGAVTRGAKAIECHAVNQVGGIIAGLRELQNVT
jgi:hypothetical protein